MEFLGFILLVVLVLLVVKEKTGASWGAVMTALKILAVVGAFYLIVGLLGLG